MAGNMLSGKRCEQTFIWVVIHACYRHFLLKSQKQLSSSSGSSFSVARVLVENSPPGGPHYIFRQLIVSI